MSDVDDLFIIFVGLNYIEKLFAGFTVSRTDRKRSYVEITFGKCRGFINVVLESLIYTIGLLRIVKEFSYTR